MAYKPAILELSAGGTNASLTASNGGIFYSTASAGAILAGTATAGQIIRSGASSAPSWSTATYPATASTSGNVLTSDGSNWISSPPATSGTVTSVSGTTNRITSTGGNTPVIDISAAYVGQTSITTLGTIATGVWNGSVIPLAFGGTNANLTASNGGIFYSTSTAGAILSGTSTANKMLLSGASTTPTWSTSTIPSSAGATANKVLLSDGTNYVLSTPTFPNASATSGKIIQSDGTNWIASTPTYPATAGSSGNVITSDGTNFVSSAPSAGGGFSFNVSNTATSPADSQTYYVIKLVTSGWNAATATSQSSTRFNIPIACTLKAVSGTFYVTGTLGSTENVTVAIRKNDTSNTNATTTLQLNNAVSTFTNTSLSTAFAANDYFDFIVICPAWATNPTNVFLNISAYFTVP